MTRKYTEIDGLLDRYLAAENTSNNLSELTSARQTINDYVAIRDQRINAMETTLREIASICSSAGRHTTFAEIQEIAERGLK